MSITSHERAILESLQVAIDHLRWRSEELDRVENRDEWLAVGRAYREATLRQASLLQDALDRDIAFDESELRKIREIQAAIEDAARKQDLVRNVLQLVGALIPR